MPFGYALEPDFNLAKEQRRNRLGWTLVGGVIVCILYLFSGGPFATEIFQGWIATSLFHGDNFYIRRRADLRKLWLWKAVIAVTPFHLLYLAAIFWSDRAFPQVMTKVIVFLPVLALGFAIESIQMDKIIDRFKPSSADPAASL
jgi:hypothetical protein